MSIYIINDNGVGRAMTDVEKAEYEQAARQMQADLDAREQSMVAALEARKEPLRKLGLTENEINTVLGL